MLGMLYWISEMSQMSRLKVSVKEQSGILQSIKTRAACLSDPTHRIRFVYVPKHTSWLN
jgi:hypothetical protein